MCIVFFFSQELAWIYCPVGERSHEREDLLASRELEVGAVTIYKGDILKTINE